jgi:hypothetical protein
MKVLCIVLIAMLLAGCSPSATPTLTTATTVSGTPTLAATTTVFEGRLLFSRFNEGAHPFTGMFVAQPEGSAVTAVPLPW